MQLFELRSLRHLWLLIFTLKNNKKKIIKKFQAWLYSNFVLLFSKFKSNKILRIIFNNQKSKHQVYFKKEKKKKTKKKIFLKHFKNK